MVKKLDQNMSGPCPVYNRPQVLIKQGAFQRQKDHGHSLQKVQRGKPVRNGEICIHGCSNGYLNVNKNCYSWYTMIRLV